MEGMQENFFEGSKKYEPAVPVQERAFEYAVDNIEKYADSLQDNLKSSSVEDEIRKMIAKMDMEKDVWGKVYGENSSGAASALFEIGQLFKRGRILNNKPREKIEARWYGSQEGPSILKEISSEEIRAKKEDAAWQQKFSIFIFENQGSPEFEAKIERYWASLAAIERKLFHTDELVKSREVGIGRLVTAATVFSQLGYRCETAGGEHDVSDSLDFVATKKIGETQISLLFQVKGSRGSDDFEPVLEMYYPLPQYSGEIPSSMFNLIRWTRENIQKIKETNPNCYAMPIFLRIPSFEDRSDEINTSGLPSKRFIDNLPLSFINGVKEAERVPLAETGSKKPRKKLRVVEFGSKKETREL